MKRLLATLALTCVLSGSAMAGHIDTCGIKSQEPAPEAEAVGLIPSTDSEAPESALTTLLLTVLSVF